MEGGVSVTQRCYLLKCAGVGSVLGSCAPGFQVCIGTYFATSLTRGFLDGKEVRPGRGIRRTQLSLAGRAAARRPCTRT
eukprot:1809117-Rhodomonas_salina.1